MLTSRFNLRTAALAAIALLLSAPALLHAQTAPAHVFIRVQAAPSLSGPLNGRLLIFLKQGSGDTEIDTSEIHLTDTWVTAREVRNWLPGTTVEVDASDLAYPGSFSALPAGTYEAQAVLDADHNYNYGGRDAADWISTVTPIANWTPGTGTEPTLTLDRHPDEDPRRAEAMAKTKSAATPDVARLEEFESPLLSKFWGHPVKIKAWIILPPGYSDSARETWPVVYWTHGFGGGLDGALNFGLSVAHARTVAGKMPPMIWVMLDESIAQGTHEFADSVNNGPWGAAFTTEFIPYLESKYRMDARATSRLLNGHSSGGWATLQLQINYPKIFGGTWSTSPDPSDFHNFSTVDLYAPNANLFHYADGSPVPIFRDKGKVVATMQQLAGLEMVLGAYGGQIASFEWVFSPKSPDGSPERFFDRATGAIDPNVVAYWRDHYDLANILDRTWAANGTDIKGRIHLYVGTADTFYLDGAAHMLEARLNKLGGEPHFTFIPGKSHFDLYAIGDDRFALFDEIASQMYATARPGFDWKKK
jgi:S-formylglutathione hydrolase FrmB